MTGSRTPALWEGITDTVCLGLAIWTLCTNAVVLAGGNLRTATAVGMTTMAVVWIGTRWLRRRGGKAEERTGEPAEPEPTQSGPTTVSAWYGAAGGCALLLAGGVLWGLHLELLWWLAVTSLALAAVGILREPCRAAPRPHREFPALVWTLAAVGAAVTLIWVRPDADDAFYVNLAVGAVDHATAPLLGGDSVLGIEGLSVMLPVYRVHSIEVLAAALSYLSGIDAIRFLHVVFPALAAPLVIFAHARLLRLVAPERWQLALVAIVAVFLLVGETHRFYSNFAMVRLQQGKAILVSGLLPLALAYALEFQRSPTATRWLRLAACQIAALGVSASGLWVLPVSIGLVLVSGLRMRWRQARVALIGVLASFYPVGVGLILRSETGERLRALPPDSFGGVELVSQALALVLGKGALAGVAVLASVTAWWWCRDPSARRLLVILPLGVALLLLNPYWAPSIEALVTGTTTYWRVLWALPIPLCLALWMTFPFSNHRVGWPWTVRVATTAALFAVVLLALPTGRVLSAANRTKVAPFGLEVPTEYAIASRLATGIDPGASVLAPLEVSPWVSALHDHPRPLVSRPHHMKLYEPELGAEEVERRLELAKMAGAPPRWSREIDSFMTGVESYGVEGICLRREPGNEALGARLASAGFHRVYRGRRYEIWQRPGGRSPQGEAESRTTPQGDSPGR